VVKITYQLHGDTLERSPLQRLNLESDFDYTIAGVHIGRQILQIQGNVQFLIALKILEAFFLSIDFENTGEGFARSRDGNGVRIRTRSPMSVNFGFTSKAL
jgi:hypothetical protein